MTSEMGVKEDCSLGSNCKVTLLCSSIITMTNTWYLHVEKTLFQVLCTHHVLMHFILTHNNPVWQILLMPSLAR